MCDNNTRLEFYDAVYDLLARTGNVPIFQRDKTAFTAYFGEPGWPSTREWRFQGHLGFGGKFWRNDGRHYVSMYREDSTPERERVLSSLNEAIEQLEREYNVR
jgi:hypothetical protein